ncbi:MAG: 16S rRNA (cytidine(1402)-2'-O)-methyltransferase [Paracoccaceae bacterium]
MARPATIPQKPAPGLYFIATPIGAARDITLRALDLLASADVLAAEDTRSLRHLMEIHGVALGQRPLWAYHDHNGAAVRPRILAALAEGRSVVYASEAGTPLVADPGFQLGRAAIAAGHPVTAAPGPSAALAALTVSGLPSDRFLFAGFPPAAAQARRTWLTELAAIPATLILYESPNRVGEMLGDCVATFGGERQAAVCRELTKRFEETVRGTLGELAERFAGHPVKGEIVVLIDRPGTAKADESEVRAALVQALGRMKVKEAAALVADMFGLPKRDIYQMALGLRGEGEE